MPGRAVHALCSKSQYEHCLLNSTSGYRSLLLRRCFNAAIEVLAAGIGPLGPTIANEPVGRLVPRGSDDELLLLAAAWAALADQTPDADLLQHTRQCTNLPTILDALGAAVAARDARKAGMAQALERLLLVQLETILHRERNGVGTINLDAIATAVFGCPWDDARRNTSHEILRFPNEVVNNQPCQIRIDAEPAASSVE